MVRVMSCVAACVGTLSLPVSLSAQITRAEASQLGVDVVTLAVGGELRGVIVKQDGESILMAVRRDWLQHHQPALLEALPAAPVDADQYRSLIERIDSWLAELGPSVNRDPVEPDGEQDDTPVPPDAQRAELLRVLRAERATYQDYVEDPLKLPPGEGSSEHRRAAYQQLITRLDNWIAEVEGKGSAAATPAGNDAPEQQNRDELIRILKSEREAFSKVMAGGGANGQVSVFLRIPLSRADVRQIFTQSDARRQLASAAWTHGVANVEERTVPELRQALEVDGIKWQDVPLDLTQLTGAPVPQDDREWAARRAIYEYEFLKRLDFQGSGNVVVQTGDGAPPPKLADLLQGMLDQQTSLALGDLLDEPIFTGLDFGGLGGVKKGDDWLKKAIRIAEKQGVRGFRVTRMTPDLQRRQSVVEDRFVAKMPDGSWEAIWTMKETQAAANAKQSDLDRIKEDPQVKEVFGLVDGLGLGTGNLDLALQFGAATMNAQQATDDEFYEFRDRYSQRLDGPPLSWK